MALKIRHARGQPCAAIHHLHPQGLRDKKQWTCLYAAKKGKAASHGLRLQDRVIDKSKPDAHKKTS